MHLKSVLKPLFASITKTEKSSQKGSFPPPLIFCELISAVLIKPYIAIVWEILRILNFLKADFNQAGLETELVLRVSCKLE